MTAFRATLAGLATALIWGAWPVYSRVAVLDGLDPLDISLLRFGVAGLLLAPLILRRGLGGLTVWQALLLTAGAGVPYVLAVVGGLSFAPAGHGGIITPSAMLIGSTLGAWLLLRERPARTRLAGLALVLTGIVITGVEGWDTASAQAWVGHGLFVLGGLLWATYTVGLRAFGADPFQATAVVSVLSLLFVLPVWLIFGESTLMEAAVPTILSHAGFQGILAAIGALYLYSVAVGYFGAGRGALFSALVPSVAVLLAVPVLNEWPGPLTITGLALTTAGMGLAFGAVQMLVSSLRKNTLSNPLSVRRSVSR